MIVGRSNTDLVIGLEVVVILLTGGSRIVCHTLCPKGSFGAISCTVRGVNGTGAMPSAGNLRESWS